jgi:uncharacterized protein (UPF0303 family)
VKRETSGGFTSHELLAEEEELIFPKLEIIDAVALGEIAVKLARAKNLPVAIEVRIDEWVVFHVSLPGTKPENDWWIARKARVVASDGHSSMYERVAAEEEGIDELTWYAMNNLPEETHALHGGGYPIHVVGEGHCGTILVSGVPQVDDHKLAVAAVREFLGKLGK